MIAKAFEFEYTCLVDSTNSNLKLNDGIHVVKQWFETEQALINSLVAWTKQGYNGVYTYFLTAENMKNNAQTKSFPVNAYGDLSEAMKYGLGMPKRLIVGTDFGYYATRK